MLTGTVDLDMWVTTISLCIIGTRFIPPFNDLTALSQLAKPTSWRHHATLTQLAGCESPAGGFPCLSLSERW
jgi:hypothetical protein